MATPTAAELLAVLDEALLKRTTTGEFVTEFTINGRTTRFESLDAMHRHRDHLVRMVAIENRRNASGRRSILARFRRTS